MELLRAPGLRRYTWLAHGFSTRRPGEFNLSYSVGQVPAAVSRNRRALLRQLGGPGRAQRWQLFTLRQRHSDVIRSLHGVEAGDDRPVCERDASLKIGGDALVTNRPGLLLAVQVADCLPILLVDPRQRVIAAVHAGWRGTAKRIAEKTVGRMRGEFGCEATNIRVAIGPGIHRCCYRVGHEVVETFVGQFSYWGSVVRRVQPSPSEVHWQQRLFSPPAPDAPPRPRPALTPPEAEQFYLDLVEANRRQLLAAGVARGHLWASPLCTACHSDRLFSHRAEHGRTGRMMGLIGLLR